MKTHLTLILAAAMSLPAVAEVQTDLSDWVVENEDGTSANWTYDGETNSWFQSINTSDYTFLYDPANTSLGKAISGTISVNTNSDDDYIGFVVGYQPGDYSNPEADYLLLSWKQADQDTLAGGMFLYHIEGDVHTITSRKNSMTELKSSTDYNGVGWEDYVDYTFDIAYDQGYLAIFVNDDLQYSLTPGEIGKTYFSEGAFGFYNFSQSRVEYGSVIYDDIDVLISEEQAANIAEAVPVSGNGILFTAMFALGVAMRRNIKK